MNFSQNNKINSGFGLKQNRNRIDNSSHNFVFSKPKYSHNKDLPMQIQRNVHNQGDDFNGDGKYIQKMTKIYEPFLFSGDDENCSKTSSFCSSSGHGNLLKRPDNFNRTPLADDEKSYSDEDQCDGVEYFQCTPSSSQAHQHENPFKPVLNSMRRYSINHGKSDNIVHKRGCNYEGNDERNYQTFIYNHDLKNQANQQKYYQSHTKIITVPNGVRIITEILRDENNERESDEGHRQCQTQTEDAWINKRIEIDLEDNSEILQTFAN